MHKLAFKSIWFSIRPSAYTIDIREGIGEENGREEGGDQKKEHWCLIKVSLLDRVEGKEEMRMRPPVELELCIKLIHSLDTDSYMTYIYMWNAKKMQISVLYTAIQESCTYLFLKSACRCTCCIFCWSFWYMMRIEICQWLISQCLVPCIGYSLRTLDKRMIYKI